ncbi:MAG: DUF6273 domain-containing protein [Oscillospiraceae bacterium]|nr:DUF6273 domain-containing protein [Oscillospiraceae bacterium]
MSIQTITSLSSSQPTGNTLDWSSVLVFVQKNWGLIIFVVSVLAFIWLYFHMRKQVIIKSQVQNGFTKTEIKHFVQPRLFLYNSSGVSDILERLRYRRIVKYIAKSEYPHKWSRNTSPLYFVFANPACGKTKFSKNLCMRLSLWYFLRTFIMILLKNIIRNLHVVDPVSKVQLFYCRKCSFKVLKETVTQSENTILIFDGFDELQPKSSTVDNVAWRKERLFEIIDMLYSSNYTNTIVITYRTTDNTNLKSDISSQSLSEGRWISNLEICEYNQDYISEKAAIKYAKRVFKVNNRKYKFYGDDTLRFDRITFWQKERIKKAIKTLYRAKNTDGKRTGKFIALPLYSAYAHILLDEPDLSQLSKTLYFQKMVDVLLEREYKKQHYKSKPKEKREQDIVEFKENLKIKLIELATYFASQKIFEISVDQMTEKFGKDFPTLFLQCKDNDTKYEFQHEEFITYFSGLGEAEKQKQLPHEIYTILESDSQLAKGNHLRFSSSPQIIWRILDYKNRENKVLLISDQILSLRVFNTTEHKDKKPNDWEASDINVYLNGDFLKAAFNDMERAKIQGGDKDRIFLLSADEARTYFSSNEDRIAYCSETALNDLKSIAKTDASLKKEYFDSINRPKKMVWWWWLRSPGLNVDRVVSVYIDGGLGMFVNTVSLAEGGVRPALWLNL